MRHVKITGMMLAGVIGLVASPMVSMAVPHQQQGQSVADAARKAKEQKKTAPKAATVWTNDTIGTAQGNINVVGPQGTGTSAGSPATTQVVAESAGAAAAAPAASAEDLANLQSQIDDAQKELASAKMALEDLQRKYDLDAAQYYGTPNYAANQQGQTMLDGEKFAIAAKKPAVETAQKKVDDLEKQFKDLGGKPATPPAKPTTPQR